MTLRHGYFTITGLQGPAARMETRGRAASAMVLADKWAASGLDGVTIRDPGGVEFVREAFRRTLLNVRKAGAL